MGPCPKGSTVRRGYVGRLAISRLTATLIFVGWYHMSGIRRKLPLTTIAPVGTCPRAHRCYGDRFGTCQVF